uniref:Uncharacterized protein n=1 Tax=Arundo donax TaxID=35708 RepID=A0A0A8YCZ2_ARUDO
MGLVCLSCMHVSGLCHCLKHKTTCTD